jgi:hypothetical protein
MSQKKTMPQPRVTKHPMPEVSGPGPGYRRDVYSARREGAVDADIGERRLSEREYDHGDADDDYRRNLGMPARRATGDHHVSRDQSGEPAQYQKRNP